MRDGWVDPDQIDHFLCHYSSEKFIPVVADLLDKAGLAIPRERWFSNLAWRGNTGAASILIMLAEFLETREIKPGEQLLCYIPESGRFMTAYMLFEAEAVHEQPARAVASASPAPRSRTRTAPTPTPSPRRTIRTARRRPGPAADRTGLDLARLPLARLAHAGGAAPARAPFPDRRLPDRMESWIPQVREGSKWMREGAASLSEAYQPLAALIDVHAGEEQNDFKILFQDYRNAGGPVDDIDALRRNPGGEALNAYLHSRPPRATPSACSARSTSSRAPASASCRPCCRCSRPACRCRRTPSASGIPWPERRAPPARWLAAVELALDCDEDGRAERRIVDTARRTAALYLMQFHHVMEDEAQ